MPRFLPVLICSALMVCSVARGDVRRPDDFENEIRWPALEFSGIDDCPDHAFAIYTETVAGGPPGPATFPVDGRNPFQPDWGRRSFRKVMLLAVPRDLLGSPKAGGPFEASPESPGVISCPIDLPPSRHKRGVEPAACVYDVKLLGGKLEVSKPRRKAAAQKQSMFPLNATTIGLAVATIVVWLGLEGSRGLMRRGQCQ